MKTTEMKVLRLILQILSGHFALPLSFPPSPLSLFLLVIINAAILTDVTCHTLADSSASSPRLILCMYSVCFPASLSSFSARHCLFVSLCRRSYRAFAHLAPSAVRLSQNRF